MSDLYVNDKLVKSDFKADETYKFEDIWGGSINQVELKDGDTVIDKHQFTLKTPAPRWITQAGTGKIVDDKPDESTFKKYIGADVVAGGETTIELKNDQEYFASILILRFKTSIPVGTVIDEEPTNINEKNVDLYNKNSTVTVTADDVEMLSGTVFGNGQLTLNFYPTEMQADNPTAMFEVGVTKKIVITGVTTTEITDPQTFTINIKWV
ncbi:hypothetical protein [Companilactobacillus mishanensis]|uniref:Uncharacterized protein n=1 Tax=Companilactobacillus mishanensis TaxID=2486008 RepID=A0A5P0ZGJ3_9LACO|nr:hypothetical protein [Companilactobacillus mishanensis]MQS52167.1 hypothetical protein [Companilactobacillus mishanensis]